MRRMVCGFCVVACCLAAGTPAQGGLIDGFEDGDTTSNPTWILGYPAGSHSVETDPIRPPNRALRAYGTDGAHRGLSTGVNQNWQGFAFEVEYLATGSYGPLFAVSSDTYRLATWFPIATTNPSVNGRWFIADNAAPDAAPPFVLPTNQWVRIQIFHKISDGLIHGRVIRVSDGAVLAQRTYSPNVPVPASEITTFELGIEETPWQYVDNIRLGANTDCNNNGTPDDFEDLTDCNTNGIPDECELLGNDCNANGTMDACEGLPDCDTNGVPDECDLASGGADCDSNGVLDVCQSSCAPYELILVAPHLGSDGPVPIFGVDATGSQGPLEEIPSPLVDSPIGVAFSADGELFIGNRHGNVLGGVGSISRLKVDACGRFHFAGRITGNGLEAVHGIAFSPWRELFAANLQNGLISRFLFDPSGNAIPNGVINTGVMPQIGVTFSPAGELFLTSGSTISRFTFNSGSGAAVPNGTITGIPPNLAFAEFSPWGELFVGSYQGNAVMRFRIGPSQELIPNGSIPVFSASGIAFSTAGELFAGEQDSGIMRRFLFDQDYQYLAHGAIATGEGLGDVALVSTALLASPDCNSNGTLDACEGLSDCNANGMPDECELASNDCNTNGLLDACEIAAGTSTDCNSDGTPDQCELAAGDCNTNGTLDACEGLPDCNTNGRPDVCDIAGGTSSDCNTNGTPDECDVNSNTLIWRQKVTPIAPSHRGHHAMAYDAGRHVAVLFGGYDGDPDAETWEWNGNDWTLRTSGVPAGRWNHALAYDSGREVTVLFGGHSGCCDDAGDTWEWNGTTWALRSTTGPAPRNWQAMTYDSTRGVTVLFGGYAGEFNQTQFGDTWEWNGTTWGLRATTGPSPRGNLQMVFDSARGVTVLFGGGGGNQYLGDTWEWNGNVWTLRSTTGPSSRIDYAMTYDATRGVTVLFGGGDSTGGFQDTWEWDGATWEQRGLAGPTPGNYTMAYDIARQEMVLFGSIESASNPHTWILAPASRDCDMDGTPDECLALEDDCNSNGIVDSCEEIADCNFNQTPDECESLADCNSNGTPDACENPGAPPALVVGAVSRKVHKEAGAQEIAINIAGSVTGGGVTSESRVAGISELRVAFDRPPGTPGTGAITLDQQTCSGGAWQAYAGAAAIAPSVSGNTLVLGFGPPLENARTYRIGFGPPITGAPCQAIEVRCLKGDVSSDGRVNAIDRSIIVGVWTGPGFSPRADIDLSGETDAVDRSIVVGVWTGAENCAP